MVEQPVLDRVFHALANDSRRSMLYRLIDAELSVGELAAPLEMSFAAASKHVQVLERAGAVRRTIVGRRHVLRLQAAPLADADHWLRAYEQMWADQLTSLDEMFRTERS